MLATVTAAIEGNKNVQLKKKKQQTFRTLFFFFSPFYDGKGILLILLLKSSKGIYKVSINLCMAYSIIFLDNTTEYQLTFKYLLLSFWLVLCL